MNAGDAFIAVAGDLSAWTRDIRRVEQDARDTGAQVERSFSGGLSRAFAGLGRGVRDTIGGISGALGGLAQTAAGFALGAGLTQLPGFFIDAAKGAAADEQATNRLSQAIANLGGDTEALTRQINERIAAGQRLAFGDDDIRDSYQTLLAATQDNDEALRRQSAAMDLARGKGISLQQASSLLARANEENVNVLRRMGIVLGDNATEADLLAAVQQRFGGQAEAYAKSTAGQFEQAQIAMGELVESLGGALLPVLTAVGGFLTSSLPAVQAWVGALAGGISERVGPAIERISLVVGGLVDLIVRLFSGQAGRGEIVDFLTEMFDLDPAIVTGPLDLVFSTAQRLISDGIATVRAVLVAGRDAWLTFVGAVSGDWQPAAGITTFHRIVGEIGRLVGFARDGVVTFLAAMQGDWQPAPGVSEFHLLLGEIGQFIGQTALPLVRDLIGQLSGAGASISAAAGQFSVFETATGILNGLAGALRTTVGFFRENEAAMSILVGVATAAATAWGALTVVSLAHTVATSAVTAATTVYTAAQWLLNAALTANPIGIIVVALAGLAAGLIYAYQHSEEFRAAVDGMWAAVQAGWQILVETDRRLRELVGGAIQAVLALVDDFRRDFPGTLLRVASDIGGLADRFKREALKLGLGLVAGLIDGLAGLGRQMIDAMTTALRSVRVDFGPFHLSAAGFVIDAPQWPSLTPPALPGFAHGGAFRVAGAGGVDSQLVAFRATPGELVSVLPPAATRLPALTGGAPGASQPVSVTINYPVVRDGADLAALRRETMAAVISALAEAEQRADNTAPGGLAGVW